MLLTCVLFGQRKNLVESHIRSADDAVLGPFTVIVKDALYASSHILGVCHGENLVAGSRYGGTLLGDVDGPSERGESGWDVRHAVVVHEDAVGEACELEARLAEVLGSTSYVRAELVRRAVKKRRNITVSVWRSD